MLATRGNAAMPAFIIAQQLGRTGETVDATLCDPGPAGWPDRRTDVPIKLRRVSERLVYVDGEPRSVVSSVGGNGTTTILINGSTKGLRNRERRAALAKASALLQQLAATLRPLRAGNEQPGLATEGLALLF